MIPCDYPTFTAEAPSHRLRLSIAEQANNLQSRFKARQLFSTVQWPDTSLQGRSLALLVHRVAGYTVCFRCALLYRRNHLVTP